MMMLSGMKQTGIDRRAILAGAAAVTLLAACGAPSPEAPILPRMTVDQGFAMPSPPPARPAAVATIAPLAEDDPKGLLDNLAPPGTATLPAAPPAAPAPKVYTNGMYAFTIPTKWRQELSDDPDAPLEFVGPVADARLILSAEPDGGVAEAVKWADAKSAAGAGLVRVQGVFVDELPGNLVVSNQHTALGPRYVRRYGFHYRFNYIFVTLSWDKFAAEAPAAQKDADELIKSWRWM